MLRIYEEHFDIPVTQGHHGLLFYIAEVIHDHLPPGLLPVRFTIIETNSSVYKCELGVIAGLLDEQLEQICSIFDFAPRITENTSHFNAVLLVPTGIGCEIGGHAGDANPVARTLASVCDTLITHPNVVNASDINDLPENGLYVEGSVITRLLLGESGIQPVRANRVLAIIDEHPDSVFTDLAINSVSAARASYGLRCPAVVRLDPPIYLKSEYAPSGRAVGIVEHMQGLVAVLEEYKGQYDAVALSTQIEMPSSYHVDYYTARGQMVNPWGGVEALLTHSLSSMYDIPTAHAPMLESQEIANIELGQVDPRMAAEDISSAFFMCVLKGLQRSPRIIRDIHGGNCPGVLTASDVSCLVIPDNCIGLPTLAALEQNIPVIAVRENKNIMRNDLSALPWTPGKFYTVDNYLEAAGIMSALKEGIDPTSLRRPLADTIHVKKHKPE
ncbi:MAG: DUF3326 domain-containing protein [Proteobacteria bacterium]|nr:DUF3326 domain-containing protein [Pseudomonadota bacterium]MBU1416851.1 DUF3326 domain-containing protein [Pseudomonadota bacterium]MBU1455511.1 DUF3326 domain-containing protein [Pseudomonadota bacterium]